MRKILLLLFLTVSILLSSQMGTVTGLDPNGDGFLSLRKKPKSTEIGRLYNRDKVKIFNRNGKYYKVEDIKSGKTGWAHSNWIRKIQGSSSSTSHTSKKGTVYGLDPNGDGFLAIRNKPKGRKIGNLYNGDNVTILEKRGKWYKVKTATSGQVGWAHGNWVRVSNSIIHNDKNKKFVTGSCDITYVRNLIQEKMINYNDNQSNKVNRAKKNIPCRWALETKHRGSKKARSCLTKLGHGNLDRGINIQSKSINKYNRLVNKNNRMYALPHVVLAMLDLTMKYSKYSCNEIDQYILKSLRQNIKSKIESETKDPGVYPLDKLKKLDVNINYDGRVFSVYDNGIIIYQLDIPVEKLGGTLDTCMNLLKKYNYQLVHIPKLCTKDKAVVISALKNESTMNFLSIDDKFKKDREISLLAVKQAGTAFAMIDDKFKKDRAFVLETVKDNGHLLNWVGAEFQNDKEVCLLALKNTKDAYKYVGENLKNDIDILRATSQEIDSNNFKREEQKNEVQWITPLKDACENSGGKFDNDNICKANWDDAQKVCNSSSARLPTIVELENLVTSCGGSINQNNKDNATYTKCYKEKGFIDDIDYWSSSLTEISHTPKLMHVSSESKYSGGKYTLHSIMCHIE